MSKRATSFTGKRIDFNAHILVAPRDEVESIEESYVLLKRLVELGFSRVVCTPRYVPTREMDERVMAGEYQKQVSGLETTARFDGRKVKVALGSEVFICRGIERLVAEQKIVPLEKRYILIRLPERGKMVLEMVEKLLIELREKDWVPILAGAERSEYLQEDFRRVNKLAGTGAMFQCGYGTMLGLNGRGAERLMEYMLERKYCDFLGTEVKKLDDAVVNPKKFEKAEKKILKLIGGEWYEKIMRNAEGVLE
ncbi:hypothetical protein IJI02_01725 [Candidatus Saccharibacteria bacterium]|nr:hypothetical protein [Candidatus Saccharibacteria bacterium]